MTLRLWKLVSRKEVFMSGEIQILSPVSTIYSVFCNRYLPSSSDRQPWVTAIAYIVLEVSWMPLANNSKGGFLKPGIRFYIFSSLWHLEGTLSAQVAFFHSNMFTHKFGCLIYNFKWKNWFPYHFSSIPRSCFPSFLSCLIYIVWPYSLLPKT